uniref:hypothetical protein n=1 Tax=Streptomyces canus TaxID=58343 RepID=UPI0027D81580|nr:hypothetical protein [Streptomyces canus]
MADTGDVARLQARLGQRAQRDLGAQLSLAAHDLGDGLLQPPGGGQALFEVHAAPDRQRRREERLAAAVLLLDLGGRAGVDGQQARKSLRLRQ